MSLCGFVKIISVFVGRKGGRNKGYELRDAFNANPLNERGRNNYCKKSKKKRERERGYPITWHNGDEGRIRLPPSFKALELMREIQQPKE